MFGGTPGNAGGGCGDGVGDAVTDMSSSCGDEGAFAVVRSPSTGELFGDVLVRPLWQLIVIGPRDVGVGSRICERYLCDTKNIFLIYLPLAIRGEVFNGLLSKAANM